MRTKRKHRVRISKKMKPAEMSVVVLSDSDGESQNERTISVVEPDATASDQDIEVITLDDSSVSNKSAVSFKIDVTPGPDRGLDFIPVPKYPQPKRRSLKRKRSLSSPEITVLEVRKNKSIRLQRLRNKKLKVDNITQPVVSEPCNVKCSSECLRSDVTPIDNDQKKPKIPELTTATKNGCRKPKVPELTKAAENDFRKPKIPEIHLSHSNILNTVKTFLTEGLRPIIIDGCNVGFGYGNGEFSIQGVIFVVQYFQTRGHEEIVCFLPTNYRNRLKMSPVQPLIKQYEKENIIIYTPSRYLNGKLIKPYDDRFIVQYASERGGVIISNDGYQDLINEESSWRTTIEKRIVNFTFARGLLMLPKDPLGPEGPTLDEMLKFP